jgi:hypothetical protein
MNKIKKLVFISLIALSGCTLSAYTNLIITMGKNNQRFVLIGGVHQPADYVLTEQEPFFKNLINNLNKSNPRQTLFFYEFVEDLGDNYHTKDISEDPELFKELSDMDGESLAKLRFSDKDRKFSTKNFDWRTSTEVALIGSKEKEHAEIKKGFGKIVETEISNFVNDLETKEKQDKYHQEMLEKIKEAEQAIGTVEDLETRRAIKKSSFMSDLHMMELLRKNKNSYSLFLVSAGKSHIELQAKFLQIEGWKTIDKINSTNPKRWTTSDPILKPLFTFPEEWQMVQPTEGEEDWTLLGSDGEEE